MSLPLAEEANFQRLIQLAQNRFDSNLLKVEAQVIEHSVRASEFLIPSEPLPKPAIRSEFLRWLATDSEAANLIDPRGIRVLAATIPKDLDLRGCRISHQLYFHACDFHGAINLMNARLRSFYLIHSQMAKGVVADGVRIDGSAFIKYAKACDAVRFLGAHIDGNLELDGTSLDGADAPLVLDGAKIRGSMFMRDGFRCSGEVRMLNAEVEGDLGFVGAKIVSTERALTLDKIVVKGLVSLSDGFQAVGRISLSGCQVFGDLSCSGANLSAKDLALDLATAQIRGHVYLNNGFTSTARISLHSTRVENSVDFSGATVSASGVSITLEKASVAGNVFFCDSFKASGRVDLPGAHLCSDLVFDDAALLALYCLNMKLDGELIWTGIQSPQQTSIWLNGASIKSLRDDRESWPKAGDLYVGGFTYQMAILHGAKTQKEREHHSHGPELDFRVRDRIDWLDLQPATDKPQSQPWLHLSSLVKASGDTAGAKQVRFAMRCRQAARHRIPLRWWKIAYARLQQEPLWILVPIALSTVIGFAIFLAADHDHAMAPTNSNAYSAQTGGANPIAYPAFNPFFYSLENDLPLVKMDQDDKWAPDPRHVGSHLYTSYEFLSIFRWILILFGWLQATALAFAVGTRLKESMTD